MIWEGDKGNGEVAAGAIFHRRVIMWLLLYWRVACIGERLLLLLFSSFVQ